MVERTEKSPISKSKAYNLLAKCKKRTQISLFDVSSNPFWFCLFSTNHKTSGFPQWPPVFSLGIKGFTTYALCASTVAGKACGEDKVVKVHEHWGDVRLFGGFGSHRFETTAKQNKGTTRKKSPGRT